LGQAATGGDLSVAQDDGFHVIGGRHFAVPTHSKVQNGPGNQATDAWNQKSEQRRQMSEALDHTRGRIVRKKSVHRRGGRAKTDRSQSASKTDHAGPEQCHLQVGELRPFFEPDPKLEPPQWPEQGGLTIGNCSAANGHSYEICAGGEISSDERAEITNCSDAVTLIRACDVGEKRQGRFIVSSLPRANSACAGPVK